MIVAQCGATKGLIRMFRGVTEDIYRAILILQLNFSDKGKVPCPIEGPFDM